MLLVTFGVMLIAFTLIRLIPGDPVTILLGEAGVRGRVKVLIGGAPVTQAYASQVGADGYAANASSAARAAKQLLGAK